MKKAWVLLLFASPLSVASDWKNVGGGADIFVAVNIKSITQYGPYRKAWVMYNYTEQQKSNDSPTFLYHSAKGLNYFSCSSRTLGAKQQIFYAELGGLGEGKSVLDIEEKRIFFSDVIPDTLGESTLEFVCAHPIKQAKPNARTAQ